MGKGITCDVVHGDNKLENFSSAFLTDPSEAMKYRTIVIVTPVVQCGHSIEICVDKGVVFFPCVGQTHNQECQQIERLRVCEKLKVIDVYAVRGGVGMNECRYEYQLNLIMNKMLPTDIRTSVTCDVIRSLEIDVAAEVCDNNNRYGVYYTPSVNNVYDIRPIGEDLEDEQVVKRKESTKVEKKMQICAVVRCVRV